MNRVGLAAIAVSVAVAVTCLGYVVLSPRSYGECMRRQESREMRITQLAVEIGSMDALYLMHQQAAIWAACCELPGVYPEDEYGCSKARSSVAMHAAGGVLAEK